LLIGLETDEFFFLLATESGFVLIIAVEAVYPVFVSAIGRPIALRYVRRDIRAEARAIGKFEVARSGRASQPAVSAREPVVSLTAVNMRGTPRSPAIYTSIQMLFGHQNLPPTAMLSKHAAVVEKECLRHIFKLYHWLRIGVKAIHAQNTSWHVARNLPSWIAEVVHYG
jgi:hypothetical protein